MPRRLQDLDPASIAGEAEGALLVHASAVCSALADARVSGKIDALLTGSVADCGTWVGHAVRWIVEYAQTGAMASGETWWSLVLRLSPLFTSAASGCLTPDGLLHPDLSTDLGVAMTAAEGRHRLEIGKPLEARHIYTLAGITRGRLSQLIKSGDVPRPLRRSRPATWRADRAKKWLIGRGVMGLDV